MTIKKAEKNRGTGAGGSQTNLNGIKFEEDIYLKDWLTIKDFILTPVKVKTKRSEYYEITKNNEKIGYYGRQSVIYDALESIDNSINSQYVKSIFSKRIFPDGFILTLNPKKLIIFEKKWQQSLGSVDEKIQTAPFKLHMFEQLLGQKGFSCYYHYILCDWFKDQQYKNVKDYYLTKPNIKVWVQGENLESLKIEDFFKKQG